MKKKLTEKFVAFSVFPKITLPAVLVNLIVISLIVIFKHRLPPVVPLFYGLPTGEGQLASNLFLILPPAVALIILLTNNFLAHLVKDSFLQKILICAGLTITILSLVTCVRIFFLVAWI